MNGRLRDDELAPIPGGRLAKPYALRWNLMVADCRKAGVTPPTPTTLISTYRTIVEQYAVRALKCARGRCGDAAIPGTSNHGLGRAVDNTNTARAYQYGRRYGVRPPSDAAWEPWHALIHLDAIVIPPPPLEPTLRKGVVNRKAVRRLQNLLRDDGIKAPLNGKYDLATRRAVRRFQKAARGRWAAKGLPVDGIVGRATWDALHRATNR